MQKVRKILSDTLPELNAFYEEGYCYPAFKPSDYLVLQLLVTYASITVCVSRMALNKVYHFSEAFCSVCLGTCLVG